jgi:Na+/proline symporter
MMQKNLTCRSLRKAQANMCCYGLAFVPVNLLFLSLGALLVLLAGQWGMSLPARGDELLPMFAATGRLGMTVVVLFVVGVVSASLSSADSALTALTTSACVDLWQRPDDPAFRRRVHFLITVVFVLLVVGVDAWGSRSVIDTIYTLVGYTYGPLLGLFAYALLNRSRLNGTSLALVCLASPLLCGIMSWTAARWQGYQFGYELLLLNGFLTWIGLCLTRNVSKGATQQAN